MGEVVIFKTRENAGIAILCHVGRIAPVLGHIVLHDTSFVSILISDTDLIIRRAQMESVIGSRQRRQY